MSKVSYIESVPQIDAFVKASRELYGDYAHAAGALSSRLAMVLEELPAHKAKEVLAAIAQHTAEVKSCI